MIDKYWVKFEGLDIKCLCKDKHCADSTICREYIIKLMEVERTITDNVAKHLENTTNKLITAIKKENNELKNSIKKLKGFKL